MPDEPKIHSGDPGRKGARMPSQPANAKERLNPDEYLHKLNKGEVPVRPQSHRDMGKI